MPRFGSRLHEGAAVGEGRGVTASEAPDLVLTRGRVYTMDAARSWAEAVAVRAGRIAAVGSSAEIEALRGPETHVVDLHDRMLLPGFQDAHLHPTSGGLMQVRCDLHGTATREQSLERTRTLRGGASRPGMDPGGRLGHGRVPRRDPVERRPGRDRSRPAGLAHEPGWARRLGELEGARVGGHLTRDRRPEGRTDRA